MMQLFIVLSFMADKEMDTIDIFLHARYSKIPRILSTTQLSYFLRIAQHSHPSTSFVLLCPAAPTELKARLLLPRGASIRRGNELRLTMSYMGREFHLIPSGISIEFLFSNELQTMPSSINQPQQVCTESKINIKYHVTWAIFSINQLAHNSLFFLDICVLCDKYECKSVSPVI